MTGRERIRAEVVAFLNSVARLGCRADGVADETNLVDAGIIDSLALVEIVAFLEERHGLDFRRLGLDPDDLASIGGILGSIRRAGE